MQERLHVVEGQLAALANAPDVLAAIASTEDTRSAIERLQEPPFHFTEVQAALILTMPWGRSTQNGLRSLEGERESLRAQLADP